MKLMQKTALNDSILEVGRVEELTQVLHYFLKSFETCACQKIEDQSHGYACTFSLTNCSCFNIVKSYFDLYSLLFYVMCTFLSYSLL